MNKTDTALMKLVARVGEIGFSLAVEHLVEVVQLDVGDIDATDVDGSGPELGTFLFRDQPLVLVDLGQAFVLKTADIEAEVPVLVMSGEQGLWGAVVGSVEGVYPESSFTTRDLPISLICTGQKLYSQLDIWRGEPLVCLEPYKIDRYRHAGSL